MRIILALLAVALAGCAGVIDTTTINWIERRQSSWDPWGHIRGRAVITIESEWLSGTFQGIVVARSGSDPAIRAQFLPDIGPKALEIAARPNRIIGYFPHQREGVDCSLPEEAVPHPLLFIGVTILEHFNPWILPRVRRVRQTSEGWSVQAASVIPGCDLDVLMDDRDRVLRRRFHWQGARWEEERVSEREYRITAPGLRIGILVLEEEGLHLPISNLEFSLPADVRIIRGSRK